MTAKTLDEFKRQHDPTTVIANLSAELDEIRIELREAQAINKIIGTLGDKLEELQLPKWVEEPLRKADAPGVPTLFLSDLHWGEVVNAREIGGVNSFNLAIARTRLQFTTERAIHLCRILDNQFRYPGIVVPLGGDIVSGNIHDELVATNEVSIMPAVIDAYAHLRLSLLRLADMFGHVFVPCVSGNHGRDTRKTWAKRRNHTSFDWLIYNFLARSFEGDKRVQFYIPEGSDALYRVYGVRYNLTHGDQFKAGDSIIGPIGPIFRGRQKKLARNTAVNQAFDVMIYGHWHSYLHGKNLIGNGSLKGYDEYAAAGNFEFEVPQQALWVTHPKYGITYRMPVYCDKVLQPAITEWISVAA